MPRISAAAAAAATASCPGRRVVNRSLQLFFFFATLASCLVCSTTAWSPASFAVLRSCARQRQQQRQSSLKPLSAQQNDKQPQQQPERSSSSSSATSTTTTTKEVEWQDEDAGAGVVGAQFFGGNKQKEEFYDPVAEAEASKLAFEKVADEAASTTATITTFNRFQDRAAFDSTPVAEMAASYQDLLNQALINEENKEGDDDAVKTTIVFDTSSLQWETPFSSNAPADSSNNNTPLAALQEASKFYRRLHVAITSATTLLSSQVDGNTNYGGTDGTSSYQLRWEMGLAWPTFWEPALLLTGTSTVTVVKGVHQEDGNDNDTNTLRIVKQVDVLDNPDLLSNLASQIVPRFWDMYHIGMTPTAEISPMWEKRQGLFQDFVLYDVPSRWVWTPTLVDHGDREDANASFLPNHAFTTAIRTMGPSKDVYIPTVPTQIEIQPSPNGPNTVSWKVHPTVQMQAQREWPLYQPSASSSSLSSSSSSSSGSASSSITEEGGGPAPEDISGSYVWQPSRRVATLPTGLVRPQDAGVTELRKRLYERVTSAGLTPKLDANGRPYFFFWSAATKTCFTDKGLGMAVYEYRAEFAQSNHVGMELEASPEIQGKN